MLNLVAFIIFILSQINLSCVVVSLIVFYFLIEVVYFLIFKGRLIGGVVLCSFYSPVDSFFTAISVEPDFFFNYREQFIDIFVYICTFIFFFSASWAISSLPSVLSTWPQLPLHPSLNWSIYNEVGGVNTQGVVTYVLFSLNYAGACAIICSSLVNLFLFYVTYVFIPEADLSSNIGFHLASYHILYMLFIMVSNGPVFCALLLLLLIYIVGMFVYILELESQHEFSIFFLIFIWILVSFIVALPLKCIFLSFGKIYF